MTISKKKHYFLKRKNCNRWFQPSLSVDPDYMLDPLLPPPPANDLDQKTTDEELYNLQIVDQGSPTKI
ncbi:unnamed protein product [Camellia sinensis]